MPTIRIDFERYMELLRAEAGLKLVFDSMEEMFDIEKDPDELRNAFFDCYRDNRLYCYKNRDNSDAHADKTRQ